MFATTGANGADFFFNLAQVVGGITMKVSSWFVMLSLLGAISLSTGCVQMPVAPFVPPVGAISSFSAPLSTEGNYKVGSKIGEASSINILYLASVGDCSLHEAAKGGNLTRIDYVDYEFFSIFGIFSRTTLIAHGE